MIQKFYYRSLQILFKWLNKRSQRKRLLKGTNKRKIQKKIRKWNELYLITKDDEELISKIQASWNSWLAHSSHANSYKLQNFFYNQLYMKEFLLSPEEYYIRQEKKQTNQLKK